MCSSYLFICTDECLQDLRLCCNPPQGEAEFLDWSSTIGHLYRHAEVSNYGRTNRWYCCDESDKSHPTSHHSDKLPDYRHSRQNMEPLPQPKEQRETPSRKLLIQQSCKSWICSKPHRLPNSKFDESIVAATSSLEFCKIYTSKSNETPVKARIDLVGLAPFRTSHCGGSPVRKFMECSTAKAWDLSLLVDKLCKSLPP